MYIYQNELLYVNKPSRMKWHPTAVEILMLNSFYFANTFACSTDDNRGHFDYSTVIVLYLPPFKVTRPITKANRKAVIFLLHTF